MNKSRFPAFLNSSNLGSLKIAGLYLLIGALWILFSDVVVERTVPDPSTLTTISIYKGWGFIVVTAILLYWLIQHHTAELREDDERLHLITDAIPALISYMDLNRSYRFSNRAFEDWFGSRADGKNMDEFLGQAVYQTIAGYVDEAMSGKRVHYQAEIPYSNGARFVDATYIPDTGANGVVKGYFSLVQDITERRQEEAGSTAVGRCIRALRPRDRHRRPGHQPHRGLQLSLRGPAQSPERRHRRVIDPQPVCAGRSCTGPRKRDAV